MPAGRDGRVEVMFLMETEKFVSALGGAATFRPTTVDQRTCERVIGISPRQYLDACRAKVFPVRKEGKRRVAMTAEVERFWTRGLVAAGSGAVAAGGQEGQEATLQGGTAEPGLADRFRLMGESPRTRRSSKVSNEGV